MFRVKIPRQDFLRVSIAPLVRLTGVSVPEIVFTTKAVVPDAVIATARHRDISQALAGHEGAQ